MICRISINLYRYEYRIEKTDRYPALAGKQVQQQHGNWLRTGNGTDQCRSTKLSIILTSFAIPTIQTFLP